MSYDFAILGGGAAGLSLALALVHSPLRDKSILIVEKDAKDFNDRNWCFWAEAPDPLDAIAAHVWPRLRFLSPGLERSLALAPFRYQLVRGLDFYRAARAELEQHNVTFVRGAGEVVDGVDGVEIMIDGEPGNGAPKSRETFRAGYAFDSRIRPGDVVPNPRYTYLKQHFTGWEVETDAPVFDPQTATLFDLRTPQRGGVTFFYVLPFSERRALVEYTLFSAQLLPSQAYEAALRGYLQAGLGITEYRLINQERGVIPMTDHPFPRRLGRRILAIGTRGGRVKPSTGYAFARIQRDSASIVDSLVRYGHPFAISPDPLRYRIYDTLLLDVLAREPESGRSVLAAIFGRSPLQSVLRFLDDRSSLFDDLCVLSACPPRPFLRAIGRRVHSWGNIQKAAAS